MLQYYCNTTTAILLRYYITTNRVLLQYYKQHYITITTLQYHYNTTTIPLQYHYNTYHYNTTTIHTTTIPLQYHYNTTTIRPNLHRLALSFAACFHDLYKVCITNHLNNKAIRYIYINITEQDLVPLSSLSHIKVTVNDNNLKR